LYGCETWSLTFREGLGLRVFENRVLRSIFEPKRDEVAEEWRKLQNGELSSLYCLPNIIWTIELKVRWAGNVAQMLGREVDKGFSCGNQRERAHLEELDVDRKIILRWVIKKWDVRASTGLFWLRIGTGGGLL
jgi:hypothetical protein